MKYIFLSIALSILSGCSIFSLQSSRSKLKESHEKWMLIRAEHPDYSIVTSIQTSFVGYEVIKCQVKDHMTVEGQEPLCKRVMTLDDYYKYCEQTVLELDFIEKSDYKVTLFSDGLVQSCRSEKRQNWFCSDCNLYNGFFLEELVFK